MWLCAAWYIGWRPMAGRLKLDGLRGPFQPMPFYEMILPST